MFSLRCLAFITIYAVLVSSADYKNAEWVHWWPGQPWPENAIIGGTHKQTNGEYNRMYIARRQHERSMVPGYAYKNGPFYIGWHGKEISYQDFELLCQKQNFDYQWEKSPDYTNPWPANAKVAGSYNEGGANSKMFVARHKGIGDGPSYPLGYAYENGPAYFGWFGNEVVSNEFDLYLETDWKEN